MEFVFVFVFICGNWCFKFKRNDLYFVMDAYISKPLMMFADLSEWLCFLI